MAAANQGENIQELKLDVGLIKADITTIKRDMTANQKIIIDRMDNFAFVIQKDYDRDAKTLDDRISDIELEQKRVATMVDAGGLKNLNFVFGNATKIILTALSLGVIIIIVVTLAGTIPAVQSALEARQ